MIVPAFLFNFPLLSASRRPAHFLAFQRAQASSMFPLIPNRYRFGDRVVAVEITRHDLIKTHSQAPDLVNAIATSEGRYSRSQALGLAVSGASPVLGYHFFHWSVALMVLAFVLDYVASWVTDLLKHLWVPELVDAEISRATDAELAVSVAVAMARPERSTRTTRASPSRPVLVYHVSEVAQHSALRQLILFVFWMLFWVLFPLGIALRIALVDINSPANALPLLLLLIPVLANLFLAKYQVEHAALDGSANPQLYPNAPASIAVFFGSLLLMQCVSMLLSAATDEPFLKSHSAGGVYLACYLVVSLAIAIFSQARNARWSSVLSKFANENREDLLAKLSRSNSWV